MGGSSPPADTTSCFRAPSSTVALSRCSSWRSDAVLPYRLVSSDYIRVTYREPHAARGRQMLAAHPELRALAGPMPASAAWTAGLVAAQLGLALLVGDRGWIVWVPCAYVIGATIDHALWVLI